jgi:hydroxymethylglutaryl-CoA synthase
LLQEKMSLGADWMRDLGNLYTAALPAWLAAGFEQAAQEDLDLVGVPMVAVGYGSGDAAESIPLSPVAGWRSAALGIGFCSALGGAFDLQQEQYEALHDGSQVVGLDYEPGTGFRIARVGDRYEQGFQDLGVEYYEYVR